MSIQNTDRIEESSSPSDNAPVDDLKTLSKQQGNLSLFFSTLLKHLTQTVSQPPETQHHFERTVGAIVDGVRGGAFPAISGPEDEFYGGFDNCQYCDFDRICSRRRDDELLEKLGDPDLARWARVAKVARQEEAP